MTSSSFVGFPDVKMRPVKVPDLFFTELAPQIDNLAELKLTLHCLWLLNEQTHDYRFLRGEDLRQDETLLRSLSGSEELRTQQNVLKDALERAVARNTLLRLEIESGEEASPTTEDWYFLNTVKGRQTMAMIRQGRIDEIRAALPDEARLRVNRPNIFLLYEQNMGALTPLIADQLRDMERSYAPGWIQDAFEIAVSRNKRNLRYVQSILRRWETEGRDGDRYETSGGDSEADRRKTYIPDEFSDIIIG
ncbi:MAG: DnaD domain protein [Litorilinea sp.]